MREYIWMPEAEIAPTRSAGGRLDEGESPAPRQNVDRPIAVISNVSTTPALLMVHVDQLHRPLKMTDASGAVVWSAVYAPFGGAYTLSGSETLNARFPGQWFQMEAGLHYNWHRHYDPSLGRYTQPDPLAFAEKIDGVELPGLQDGPSLYAYSGSSPQLLTDPDGQNILKKALEFCKNNPQCKARLAAAGAVLSKCRCKIAKHGRDHYFPGYGFCEHYQLTCWIKGQPGSDWHMYWALPGRCSKFKSNEPEVPMTPREGAPGE